MRSPGRRRLLRFLGAAAVAGSAAGCTALTGDDEAPTTIPAEEIASVVDPDAPAVPRTVPVAVGSTYLDEAAARAGATLEPVPTPFTPTEIPNGAIRRELTGTAEHARTLLEDAGAAPTAFEALRTLERARGEAAALAAGWAAIEDGLTRAAVADRGDPILADVAAFADRWSYVGDDPRRATVVHAVLEAAVRRTRARASVEPAALEEEPENPLTVAELAGEMGRARAAIADAGHLYDRYRASLSDPGDLGPTIREAAVRLEAAGRAAAEEIPASVADLVDGDVSGTPAEAALEDLRWRVEDPDGPGDALADGRPALATRYAHGLLARGRALEALRDRVNDGETFAIGTAADLEARREAALTALSAAAGAPFAGWDRPHLADRLRRVDRRIAGEEGTVRAASLEHRVAEYVVVAGVAGALPPTGEQVLEALGH